MAAIAGLQDFRQTGSPADIGTFEFPCEVLVIEHTFNGTDYICALRAGERGWILIDMDTDAATVVNSAITSLTHTYKETVIVRGDLTMTAVILLYSYLVLEIQGTWTLANGSNCHMIDNVDHAGGNTMIEVIGGELSCNGANQAPARTFSGINFTLVSESAIRNIYIHDANWYGIQIGIVDASSYLIMISGCITNDNNDDGIEVSNSNHITIVVSLASGNGLNGFECENSPDCTISGCVASRNEVGAGIEISGSLTLDCTAVGNVCICQFDGNGRYGININADRITVTGNVVTTSSRHGIYLNDASNNIVVGNIVKDADYWNTTTYDGISLDEDSSYNLIAFNTVHDSDRYEINISAATCISNTVVYNNLRGTDHLDFFNDAGTDTILLKIKGQIDPGVATVTIGDGWGVNLPDAADTHVRINWEIPLGLQQLVRCRILVIPLGTGNMAYSVATDFGKRCVEVYTTHSDTKALGVQAVTLNEIECIDVDDALTAIAEGDFVLMDFLRDGDDASDTVGAACVLVGAYAQYV